MTPTRAEVEAAMQMVWEDDIGTHEIIATHIATLTAALEAHRALLRKFENEGSRIVLWSEQPSTIGVTWPRLRDLIKESAALLGGQ